MAEHAYPELESWALGALLDADGPLLAHRGAAELVAAGQLQADDFTHAVTRAVFQAVGVLAECQRPVTAQTVAAICKPLGGDALFERLSALQGGNACNREAYLAHAEELRRLSKLRHLEAFHRRQLEALQAPRPDVSKLAEGLDTFAQAFAGTAAHDETGDRDVAELIADWEAAARGERLPIVPTGIRILDELCGGFVPNLNVIGGMPSVGKSALIGEVILALLERGMCVGLFGLEDATKWLPKRHMARALGLPVGAVGAAALSDHHQERLADEAGRLSNLLRSLLVYRRAGIDPATLAQRCKHWVLNRGVRAIFVDHGGEVQHERGGRDRFDLAVANTYRQLRDLAVNHRVPVVVLCHFNRATESERAGVPSMQSFAETEYIARMARLALGLWEKPGDPSLRVSVLKRTEGPRDVTAAIERDEGPALVRRTGGRMVDVEAERRAEKDSKRSKRKEELWATRTG